MTCAAPHLSELLCGELLGLFLGGMGGGFKDEMTTWDEEVLPPPLLLLDLGPGINSTLVHGTNEHFRLVSC